MVTTATTTALVVIYAPSRSGDGTLAGALDLTASRIVEYAGGRESSRLVV
jgi:DNA/RNA-binding domain of Phe-tRNA-synthetase-like protein